MPRQAETNISNRVRVAVSQLGCKIFRNPVGFDNDRKVRYGLARGSPDLVGWLPIEITEKHLGMKLAVFVGIEVKGKNTAFKEHQRNFLNQIASDGGIAVLARGNADDAIRAINEIRQATEESRSGHIRGYVSDTQRRERKNTKLDD